MDSKAIIAIAIAAVVVIAGAGVAVYLMNKDTDDEPKSDYSLLDSGKEIKGSFVYIDEKKSNGLQQKVTTKTAVEVKPGDIGAIQELYTKYSDYTEDLTHYSVKQLFANFFDFDGSAPSGVNVTKTTDGPNTTYAITGEGDILGEDGSKKTVKFSDDFYVKLDSGNNILDAKGKASVDGKYVENYNTFDYDDLSVKFADGKAVSNGKSDVELTNCNYPSSEAFANAVFAPFDLADYGDKVTTKDVNYKGVDCKEHVVKGVVKGMNYDVTFHSINGLMIDGDGTVDGNSMSETVKVYYL